MSKRKKPAALTGKGEYLTRQEVETALRTLRERSKALLDAQVRVLKRDEIRAICERQGWPLHSRAGEQ